MAIPPDRIVTLLTDFGLSDGYVAAMKGVILDIHSQARIVDISHQIAPQQVAQASFVAQTAWPYFPPGTVHVAVVDPGVGSERRAIVLVNERAVFVGPDNGVLSSALPDSCRPAALAPEAVAVPDGTRVFELTERRYQLDSVSVTFHGRDIFAPAAAHLALGVRPELLGQPVDSIIALPPLRARKSADGSLQASVIHIDRFGNAVVSVRAEDLGGGQFSIQVAGRVVRGPVRTYAEAAGLAAIVGSAGYVEIALKDGDAAAALGVAVGDPVVVRG
jgi:S-adenosylmethionine hydrolase